MQVSFQFYRRILKYAGSLFMVFFGSTLYAQHGLSDTIFVNFIPESYINLDNIYLRQIIDSRNEHPHFIRYGSEKKYLIVPSDIEVFTNDSLALEILTNTPSNRSANLEVYIDMQEFRIVERKTKIGNKLFLLADLALFKHIGDSSKKIGTYYYEYPYLPKRKKETIQESSENLLTDWHRDFKLDLLTLQTEASTNGLSFSDNLIRDISVKPIYLNLKSAVFVGYNWWGFQGELYFSRPETKSHINYSSGIIRYQNNPDYESFAIGKTSEHKYWRRNESWIFDVDFNFLLGFCKWKDIDTHSPTLYQLFDFELSSIQSIEYCPKNSKGLTFRMGLIENFSWVILKKPKFQPGVIFGFGVKL